MPDPTVHGAVHATGTKLTASEHLAAMQALAKLSGAQGVTQGVASVLGGSLRSATQSGGAAPVAGRGSDTFVGGVQSSGARPVISTLGSDTVVAGSSFTGKIEAPRDDVRDAPAHSRALSGDTISVAGVTAASVKTEPVHAAKVVGQTITLSDKTTITLTGVSTHDATKPQ